MKALFTSAATTILLSGALGLAAGTAQATPGTQTWCPGQPMPTTVVAGASGRHETPTPMDWDMAVCHDWYYHTESADNGDHVSTPIEGEYPYQLGAGL